VISRSPAASFALRASAAFLTLGSVSCITVSSPSFMRSPAERSWPSTLSAAQQAAAAARFNVADSLLVDFARTNPGSTGAVETNYWLALYALDPANPASSLDVATNDLRTYLAATGPKQHQAEATSLSRVAGVLSALTREAAAEVERARAAGVAEGAANAHATDVHAAEHTDTTSAASSDAEVKRLRDELAKANAELDRIRKRLTTGGKPPA